MPKQVSDYQFSAASYCRVPQDPEALGTAFSGLLDCIDELNLHVWYFQFSGVSFGFAANTNQYAAPIDFKASRQLDYLNDDGAVAGQFEPVDPKTFRVMQAQVGSTTVPKYYTVDTPYPSGIIRLSQAPDQAFVDSFPSGHLSYYSRIPYPDATTSIIDVPPEVEQWIMWNLRTQLAIIYATPERTVVYAQVKADKFWEQLRINHRDDEDRDWR